MSATFGMLARRATDTDAAPTEDVPPYEPGSLSRLYTDHQLAIGRQDDATAKTTREKMRLVVLSMRGLVLKKGAVL